MKLVLIFSLICISAIAPAGTGVNAMPAEFEIETFQELCQAIPAEADLRGVPTYFNACRELLDSDYGGADTYFYIGRILFLLGDVEKARLAFRTGHSEGDIKATTALAYVTDYSYKDTDLGIATDTSRLLYEQAAKQLDSAAILVLGIDAFVQKKLSEQDEARALALFSQAASLGNPVAHLFIADFYLYRREAEPDDEKVIEHLTKAAIGGVGPAAERLEELGIKAEDIASQSNSLTYPYATVEEIVLWRP